jgi:glycerophosphoryl diester phosphodiesterase
MNENISYAQDTVACQLIGHRGAAAIAPENTLASFQKAIAIGVDRIETDVHMTSDGQIILMHDRTLNRTTSGKGEVRNHTLAEIRQLDAGSWFAPEYAGERVPTLDEAIKLCKGKCLLMIEVKESSNYTPGIEEAVAEVIRANAAQNDCVVISLQHSVIFNFHQLAPDIRLHRSYVGKIPLLPIYLDAGITFRGFRCYSYVEEFNLNKEFISSYTMKRIQRMGKKVNAWTDDDPQHAAMLIRLGVSGIITNNPGKYRQSNK